VYEDAPSTQIQPNVTELTGRLFTSHTDNEPQQTEKAALKTRNILQLPDLKLVEKKKKPTLKLQLQ